MASQHQQLCTVVPRNGALYHPYVPPAMLLLFQLQEGYDGSLHLASCLYHQYVNIPLRGKSSFFHPSFRLQLTVIEKWVTVVDDVIETATMLIQIHSALELGIILVVRVELGYLHYAARCCTFSRPIYYRIRWPPERPPLIVGSYTELFTGSCWEFLHLLAIFNWPLSTNDAGFDWWYLFTSAMRCVLARLYHQSRLCSPGICNWSNYRHDWLNKRERFFTHQSRCESGKYPFKKITYQDWFQFFKHRRWVSIFMFWI